MTDFVPYSFMKKKETEGIPHNPNTHSNTNTQHTHTDVFCFCPVCRFFFFLILSRMSVFLSRLRFFFCPVSFFFFDPLPMICPCASSLVRVHVREKPLAFPHRTTKTQTKSRTIFQFGCGWVGDSAKVFTRICWSLPVCSPRNCVVHSEMSGASCSTRGCCSSAVHHTCATEDTPLMDLASVYAHLPARLIFLSDWPVCLPRPCGCESTKVLTT